MPLESELGSIEPSRLGVYHVMQLGTYLRACLEVCFGASCISKKHFHLGGMAASEWMHSVRAVRDTQEGDYSVHGINTTCRIAYRPPIAILPFLVTLSVSSVIQTLWHCGQP